LLFFYLLFTHNQTCVSSNCRNSNDDADSDNSPHWKGSIHYFKHAHNTQHSGSCA